MRIFLVGYMGCGKSTVAKKLAQKLGLKVVDLDAEIVKAAGISIPQIFKNSGEENFRRLEKRELDKWLKEDGFVMATGGGTPCSYENMNEMMGVGETVYLQMSPKALVDRLANSKQERPILKGLSPDKMLEKVTKQLAKREAFYKRSKFTVDGLNFDMGELLKSMNPADS